MQFWKLLPAIVWAFVILLLTGLPGTYFPTIESFWDWLSPDKIVHVIMFMIQTILLLYALYPQYLTGSKRLITIWIVIAVVTLYGLTTEVLQAYVFVGRHGSAYDFVADFVGVLVGLKLFNMYCKKICIKLKAN